MLGLSDPKQASSILRDEEQRRIQDIRALVITSVNNQPVRVEDVVEGGRASAGRSGPAGRRRQPSDATGTDRLLEGRQGPAAAFHADASRQIGHDEPDVVECIVLMRKNEETLPALRDVKAKVDELNDPDAGRMLPGVKIEPYYDRSELLAITTETVRENLLVGMALVTIILLMFLSNVRSALIVAINIPLALLLRLHRALSRGACRPTCCRSGRSTSASSSTRR